MISNSDVARAWRHAEACPQSRNLLLAAPALELALALYPNAVGFRNLALIRLQLGKPDMAIIACDAALGLSPLDHEAHGLRGDILFALGKFSDAIESYRNAVRICPSFAQAWSNMCAAIQRTNAFAEALQASSTAFSLAQDRPDFAIQHGLLLVQAARYQEGRTALETGLKRTKPTFNIAHSLFTACHLS